MKRCCGFSAGVVFVCFLKVCSHLRASKQTQVQDVMKSDFVDVLRRLFAVCSLTVRRVFLQRWSLTSHWILLLLVPTSLLFIPADV